MRNVVVIFCDVSSLGQIIKKISFSLRFGSHSIEVGHELVKYTDVLLNELQDSGHRKISHFEEKTVECRTCLERASNIFELHYGKWNSTYKEIIHKLHTSTILCSNWKKKQLWFFKLFSILILGPFLSYWYKKPMLGTISLFWVHSWYEVLLGQSSPWMSQSMCILIFLSLILYFHKIFRLFF